MWREGSGQPTVLAFIRSLARFLGYFSGLQTAYNIHNKISYIHNYTFPVIQLYEHNYYCYEFNYQFGRCSWWMLVQWVDQTQPSCHIAKGWVWQNETTFQWEFLYVTIPITITSINKPHPILTMINTRIILCNVNGAIPLHFTSRNTV